MLAWRYNPSFENHHTLADCGPDALASPLTPCGEKLMIVCDVYDRSLEQLHVRKDSYRECSSCQKKLTIR